MINNVACVFPGQGSQSIGMLAELAECYPSVIETFHDASVSVGWDVWKLIQTGTEAELNQTTNTQVAMLTADVAIFRLLKQLGLTNVSFMAGHSLGEYAALVSANAISLANAVQLVAHRARLMQETIPLGQGAMAAIVGLTDSEIANICQQASTNDNQVTPANYNAIGQVVIAGSRSAIQKAVIKAEEQGARLAKIIPVSVPCHCPLLIPAATSFETYLAKAYFKVPNVNVISNVDLTMYQSTTQIRQLLKEQLFKPVRWVETIQLLKSKQINLIIECGPGRVLSGLIKRIDKTIPIMSVFDKPSLDEALSHLKTAANCY